MGGGWGPGGSIFALRIARMAIGLSAVVLALSNLLFVQSGYLRIAVISLVVLWVVLTVVQMVYFSRARRSWRAAGMGADTSVNMVLGPDKTALAV